MYDTIFRSNLSLHEESGAVLLFQSSKRVLNSSPPFLCLFSFIIVLLFFWLDFVVASGLEFTIIRWQRHWARDVPRDWQGVRSL